MFIIPFYRKRPLFFPLRDFSSRLLSILAFSLGRLQWEDHYHFRPPSAIAVVSSARLMEPKYLSDIDTTRLFTAIGPSNFREHSNLEPAHMNIWRPTEFFLNTDQVRSIHSGSFWVNVMLIWLTEVRIQEFQRSISNGPGIFLEGSKEVREEWEKSLRNPEYYLFSSAYHPLILGGLVEGCLCVGVYWMSDFIFIHWQV